MITCIINGMAAYPAANQSIKITYANQYVSDDGEYSYDISFPMDIADNRRVFKNVSRFDVGKRIAKYDDCKLYVDGKSVMSGVGTVISVSESTVKLQILGGKSRIKYNSKLTQHYIDEMDLGSAVIDMLLTKVSSKEIDNNKFSKLRYYNFYRANVFGQIGIEGMWVFSPTYDESNDLVANYITGSRGNRYITNLAVHPNLIYILRLVIEYEGYRVKRNDLDVYPWNRLYIASAYKTTELRRALPHWTAYTLIEELRKLFNARIAFNEADKTVSIILGPELVNGSFVEQEPLDEYSVDFDEEGSLSTMDTANIEYNLQDSANRGDYVSISKKIREFFDIHTTRGLDPNYDQDIQAWDEKKRRTTIVQREGSNNDGRPSLMTYYIWVTDENDKNGKWMRCGEYSPLIRNKDTDDTVSLNISPATIFTKEIAMRPSVFPEGNDEDNRKRCLLSVPNDKEADAKTEATDEDGYAYVTVEDAMSDESSMDNSEDGDECMPIYFLDEKMQDAVMRIDSKCICDNAIGEHYMAWPIPVTDDNSDFLIFNRGLGWSLSLIQRANYGVSEFHQDKHIDNHNSICVKFRSNTIPNPSDIYILRNKQYICEKIEMDIKNDQIEPIYTGYFYMKT